MKNINDLADQELLQGDLIVFYTDRGSRLPLFFTGRSQIFTDSNTPLIFQDYDLSPSDRDSAIKTNTHLFSPQTNRFQNSLSSLCLAGYDLFPKSSQVRTIHHS